MLSAAVLAVLLIAGLAVNRLVSGSLEQELSAAERDRITVVAGAIGGVDLGAPRAKHAVGGRAAPRRQLHAWARAASIGPDGQLLVDVGRLPPGVATETITEAIPGSDGAALRIEVPRSDRAFLRIFNLSLLGAGLLAIVAVVGVALLLSSRLTRPLQGVAAAARRLGHGDLTARADGRAGSGVATSWPMPSTRWPSGSSAPRCCAGVPPATWPTTSRLRPPCWSRSCRRWSTAWCRRIAEQLDRARAAAGALSGVIVQLGELVDAESAVLQRRPQVMPLGELLAEVERAIEPLFREAGRSESWLSDGRPAHCTVDVDPTQVGRALRNVLANAAQHSPVGATVRVAVEAAANEALVRVTDAGPGIAAEDLSHVFERFYRADQARGAGEPRSGSGIGLTIARELLAANGGSIAIERTGPEGTTFAIALPLAG